MNAFLDLPNASPGEADVILLPLPFEGTVSYGRGTARGPAAILDASRQVETFDEETGCELDKLTYCWADEVHPVEGQAPGLYLDKVLQTAASAHGQRGFVIGVGGEHSVTAPLVEAASGSADLSGLTIVQFDAHVPWEACARACVRTGNKIDRLNVAWGLHSSAASGP